MTIPRIFLKRLLIESEIVKIAEANFHYLIRVMRLKKKDRFYCVDETGREFIGEILEIKKNLLLAKVSFLKVDLGIGYDVSLYYGFLKGDKNELVVSIASSLGISKIVPINMERTVVRLEREKAKNKKERLQKIAIESARVSYIAKEPIVEEISNLMELDFEEHALKILFSEKMGLPGLVEYQERIKSDDKIILFFGPEGGISDDEFNFLVNQGFMPVSLGERVVKAEIAIMYALSVIRFIKYGKL